MTAILLYSTFESQISVESNMRKVSLLIIHYNTKSVDLRETSVSLFMFIANRELSFAEPINNENLAFRYWMFGYVSDPSDVSDEVGSGHTKITISL